MISDFLREHGEYHDDKYFKELTTLKMGGHIAHFVMPDNLDDLMIIVNYLKTNKVPFKVIGNGSNLVCGESEYDGVVISLKKLDNYYIENNILYAEAGVMVPMLANNIAKQGYSALEFASGIPGCIGGLVYMNAGAYKGSMSDVVEEVLVLKDGQFVWLNSDELQFSYRHSIFQDHPHWVVVAAKISLIEKNPDEMLELMADRLRRRRETQPLDMPSAGSCFRNPEDNFAWQLIDGIGYRGLRVNGVCVSEKHSNFIVNEGDGTAEDYLNIVYKIIDEVKNKYGVKLVMEVEKFNC